MVTLWDLQTGEQVAELVHNPELQVLPVVFSADGRLLASGSEDGTAVIWDVESRTPVRQLKVLDDVLFTLAFSPDGEVLAAGGKGNAISLYNVLSGELIGSLGSLPDWIFDLSFSPDGTQLLAASRDGALMLWDVIALHLLHTFRGEDGRTLSVAYVDQDTAVSSASTGNIRVWSLPDRRLRRQIAVDDFLVSMAQSGDGSMAALGLNQTARLVALESGETIREFALPGGADPVFGQGDVTALALDSTGQKLLTGTDDGTLILWNTATGQELDYLEGHDRRINDLATSPDGRIFLSAAEDRRVILWDGATGEMLWHTTNPTDTMNAVAFSPDGRMFAAGAGTFRFSAAPINPDEVDYSVTIWDTETRAELARLEGHEGPVTALAFSPDGRQLLSGSIDTTLRLWDVAGGVLQQRLVGHTSGVMSAAFADDGRYAASGSQDGSLLLWDLENGDLLRRISVHEGVVHHVAFAGTPDAVWSAAEDGWLRQWDLAPNLAELLAWTQTNRYIPELPCDQYARYGLAVEGVCAGAAPE